MRHKRRRPKHQRAGCLMCKPWKDERGANGREEQPIAVRRALQADDDDIDDYYGWPDWCDDPDCDLCNYDRDRLGVTPMRVPLMTR